MSITLLANSQPEKLDLEPDLGLTVTIRISDSDILENSNLWIIRI